MYSSLDLTRSPNDNLTGDRHPQLAGDHRPSVPLDCPGTTQASDFPASNDDNALTDDETHTLPSRLQKSSQRVKRPSFLRRKAPGEDRKHTIHRVLTSLFRNRSPATAYNTLVDEDLENQEISLADNDLLDRSRDLELTKLKNIRFSESTAATDSRFSSQKDLSLSLELMSTRAFIFSGPSLRDSESSRTRSRSILFEPSIDSLRSAATSSRYSVIAMSRVDSNHCKTTDSASVVGTYTTATDRRAKSQSLESAMSSLNGGGQARLIRSNTSRHRRHATEGAQSCISTAQHDDKKFLPPPGVRSIVSHLDSASLCNLRLVSRSWYAAVGKAHEPTEDQHLDREQTHVQLSPSQDDARGWALLPTEILMLIYQHLHPMDFDAARRTCRVWRWSSQDQRLLVTMLKRGGWWSSVSRTLKASVETSDDPDTIFEDEWKLSCALTTQCALSWRWEGHATKGTLDGTASQHRLSSPTPFETTSVVDFSALSLDSDARVGSSSKASSLLFTPSLSGRFILIAESNIIFVYELVGSDVIPYTSIAFQAEVVAMTIDDSDESARREFALAALLTGRKGVLCELRRDVEPSPLTNYDFRGEELVTVFPGFDDGFSYSERSFYSIGAGDENLATSRIGASPGPDTHRLGPRGSPGRVSPRLTMLSVDVRGSKSDIVDDLMPHLHRLHRLGRHSPAGGNIRPIAFETGPRRVYNSVGSYDDPPMSVSICAGRQCVAFGCSAQIELHWVKNETFNEGDGGFAPYDNNLRPANGVRRERHRSFPLSRPSDHIYFMPSISGQDPATRLRLISSVAPPSERGARGNADHYNATPLSDGLHYLFTDPDRPEEIVWIGTDAFVGERERLRRKIALVLPPQVDQREGLQGTLDGKEVRKEISSGPNGASASDNTRHRARRSSGQSSPLLYATLQDLSYGVRVVVASKDNLILFSISPDMFSASRAEERGDGSHVPPSPTAEEEAADQDHRRIYTRSHDEATRDVDWLDWHRGPYPRESSLDPRPWTGIKPLRVGGTVISSGTGAAFAALAVVPSAGPGSGFVVWAFDEAGTGRCWSLGHGASAPKRHVVHFHGGMETLG